MGKEIVRLDFESYAQLYQQKQNDLQQVQKAYKTELGDQEVEDVKKKLNAYGDLSGVRNPEEITEDIVETRTALNQLEQQAKEARQQIEEWTAKYGSSDEVMLALADTSRSIKDLESDLEELPSLPDGYASSEAFIEEVNRLDRSVQDLKEQVFEKKQERTRLEAEAPDTSSEELQRLLEDAENEFEKINRKAETLARVREKALHLIQSVDSDTYKGLESGFVK